MKKLTWLYVTVACITLQLAPAMILLLLVYGCNGPTNYPNVSNYQKEETARIMRVQFPKSTQFLLYHYEAMGMDDCLHLKVAMSSRDVKKFLSAEIFQDAQIESDHQYVNDVPDWQMYSPSTAKKISLSTITATQCRGVEYCNRR